MPHRSVYENRVKQQGNRSAQGFFQRSALLFKSDGPVDTEKPNTGENLQSSHFHQDLSLIPIQASEGGSLPGNSFSQVQVRRPIQMKLTIGQPKDRFAPIQKMDWQPKKTNTPKKTLEEELEELEQAFDWIDLNPKNPSVKPKKTMEEKFDEIDLMLASLNEILPTPQENFSPEKKQSSSLSSLKELTDEPPIPHIKESINITARRDKKDERVPIAKVLEQWKSFYTPTEQEYLTKRSMYEYGKADFSEKQILDQYERQSILADTVSSSEETVKDNLTALIDMKGNLQTLGSWRVEIGISDNNEEEPYIYIEDLASAPWNVRSRVAKEKDDRAVQGAGKVWICEMIKISQKEGCDGRLRLNAFASSTGFYEKLGFKWKSDRKYKKNKEDEKIESKSGVELTSEAASKLLEKNK
jgi:hypothetical protein